MKNNYFVNEADKIVQVELTQGQWACFDLADLDLVQPYRWHAHWYSKNGSFYSGTEIREGGKRKTLQMHRLIMGLDFGDKRQVDHIHHMTLDNRRSQLRVVTQRGNLQNMKMNGSSQYPGVHWSKNAQKWQARIKVNGTSRHLGYFEDELDAAEAYRRACEELTVNAWPES